jgi:phosphatidylserine synthase 2
MVVIIVLTEVLIVLKFDWETVTRPFPMHVTIFWIVFASSLVGWTIWHFYVKRYLNWREKRISNAGSKLITKKSE